jgi:hypothetical protein
MRDGGIWGTRPFGWCFTTSREFVGCKFLWWHGGVARKSLSIRWRGNVPWAESPRKLRENIWGSSPKCR